MLFLLLILSQINIKTELDAQYKNKKITVGDQFEITVTITHPQDTDISEPFVDSMGHFMVIDQEHKTVQEKGIVHNKYIMRMVGFEPGEMKLPVFKVLHTVDNTKIDTIISNEIPFSIARVLPEDMTDINDLKKAVEFPNFLPLIIVGIIITCGVMAYALYRFLKKLRRSRTADIPLPPPWIEALAAIDNIPMDDWLAKGLIKKYYYALSEILKNYLERRFEFNAAEQTTTEIIDHLKSHRVQFREDFGKFFIKADLVKYAKVVPPRKEIGSAVQTAKDLVQNTRPEQENKVLR